MTHGECGLMGADVFLKGGDGGWLTNKRYRVVAWRLSPRLCLYLAAPDGVIEEEFATNVRLLTTEELNP